MSDPTQPVLPPATCAYPGCQVELSHDRGGTCADLVHRAWLDNAIAACNAGDPAALEVWEFIDPSGLHPERALDPVQGELFTT